MKILFSITYYHPYVSGLTIAAQRWVMGLRKAGHTVNVLCMSGKGKGVITAKPLVKISKGFLSFDWIVRSWHLARIHDVVVVNLPQFEGLVTAIAAKLQGKRVVTVYHCELALPDGWINTIIQSLVEVSHFLTLLLSDAVIPYTRDYATHSRLLVLWRRYTTRDVVPIIPPIPLLPVRNRVRTHLIKQIGERDIVVGIAARLAAEKGIEYVLEAIPMVQKSMNQKDIKIVIAGPQDPVGEQAYKARITKHIRRYRASVVFLGSIDPSDMGSFYSVIDVLVLPSINSTEAFGMVQVEAMLHGVPVVASDLAGVRVPIQKTGMGIVVPVKNSRALAEAIETILRNKPNYTNGGVALRSLSSVEASIEKFRRVISLP